MGWPIIFDNPGISLWWNMLLLLCQNSKFLSFIAVVESLNLDSSIKQLNELLSKISSSIGFSRTVNNFVIQKEKEKLTIFPLGVGNFSEEEGSTEYSAEGLAEGSAEYSGEELLEFKDSWDSLGQVGASTFLFKLIALLMNH